MRNKSKRIPLLLAGAAAAMLTAGGGIYARSEAVVTNTLETGVVDIKLSEYMEKDGKRKPYEFKNLILPNMDISKIPVIENKGNDCYVRAKLAFTNGQDFLEENLYGWNDSWVKASDGYYYCTDMLETGDEVPLFEGLHIPEDYSEEYEGLTFDLNITAEAVQAKNFSWTVEEKSLFRKTDGQDGLESVPEEGDTVLSPWGNIEIENCLWEDYDIEKLYEGGTYGFAVSYEGEADKLVLTGEDFFANFSYMMPGDTFEDSAALKNTSGRDIMLYFRTDAPEEEKLLEAIHLDIYLEDGDGTKSLVYEGPLKAGSLSENILLCTLASGQEGKLSFALQVPAELKNEYTLNNAKVNWIFSTELVPEKGKIVDTGDRNAMKAFGFVLAGAGAALAVSSVVLTKKIKEENA